MLDFKLLTDMGVPSNIPSNENFQEECSLEDIVVTSNNKLVAVESLEDDKQISTESLETIVPSVENLDTQVNFRSQSGSVKKALQKLEKATGLNFDQPQPKPPPSIMIEGGVCRAYLQGACYLTMAPLIHLLVNATEEDKFAIEIDVPYLGMHDIISLATAIDASNAFVEVSVRRIDSMYTFMLLDVADKMNIAPNVHHVGPMSTFAMGSSLDAETTVEAFKSHEEYVHNILVERGFLTEDELQEITEKGKSVRFTTEELLSRINI